MTECLITQLIQARMALPIRPYRLMLSAPIGRTNRSILLSQEGYPSGKISPSAETAGFARYRQGPVATSVPTENVLSP